jgi:chromosome segregation ATPase
MGDVHFRCVGCRQSLVADATGAGVSFECPHCGAAQTIPTHTRVLDMEVQVNSDPAHNSLGSNGPHPAAPAGADADIAAMRAEFQWLGTQLDEERARREAMEPDLALARSQWAAAEQRATDFETRFNQAVIHQRDAEIITAELTHQLETAKGERTEAFHTLTRHEQALAETVAQLQKSTAERAELEQILARSKAHIDETTARLTALQATADKSASDLATLQAEHARLRTQLDGALAEHQKVDTLIHQDHDLARFVEVKIERDRLETELLDTQARHRAQLEKAEALTAERDGIKRERTDLQLKIAALRDSQDDTQLQQDNEILRRMVERLNEELKELQPDPARRKRLFPASGTVSGLARAALARCLIPDPDVAEGR